VSATITEVKESILRVLNENSKKILPRRLIEQSLSNQYGLETLKRAIMDLLDEFVIDFVVDYPPDDSELDFGHPVWFVKILTEEESHELRELSPLKLRLLQILRETSDDYFPGEAPFDEVKAILLAEGFNEDDIEWVIIKNKVTKLWSTIHGKQTCCFTLIPEYEKTEEYKRAREEAANHATEKEIRDMELDDL
jgi:hypothetical protein